MPENVAVLDERDLARTYNTPAYDDPYAAVMDYQAVMRYASEHPNKGSGAISSALEIPRGRIRPWLESGSKPDPARAIDVARELGWLDARYLDREFVGLNTLVANVFSGGSISTGRFEPSFALNYREHRSHVIDALEMVGLEYGFHNEESDDHATEVRPTEHSSVLGRTLAVLGAPVGPKADLEDLTLPWYLENAPYETREMFVLAYLANRGTHHRTKDTITVQEDRPESYRRELAALVEDVAKEPVTVGEQNVTVSAAAARSLGIQPRYESERIANRE
ncbi:hypothetical protein OB955_09220 [Halobacteria archaeon AArc-m2/3/4]|uniref:XRE family transcriptional regulator n=1 Tax=Natronoglomus mannanivorans TaxID=2979990 RepID=A0ABT2QDB3_9EURY|nr:hypothetical protein [Halobacteria archaeon AArc-m2/3/4]